MKILALTKISHKGTLHLPKAVAEKLGLENSDTILWVEEDGKVYVKKA